MCPSLHRTQLRSLALRPQLRQTLDVCCAAHCTLLPRLSPRVCSAGDYDAFIARLDSSGGAFSWSVRVGGSGHDKSHSVCADGSGGALVVGHFSGTVVFGSISLTSSGGKDAFILKIDSSGGITWAVAAGGSGDDKAYGVTRDADAGALVTGYFAGAAGFGAAGSVSSQRVKRHAFTALCTLGSLPAVHFALTASVHSASAAGEQRGR